MNYSEKLKHPKWQKKRLEVLEKANFTCELCGETEVPLHVHHKTYQKNKDPWEYHTSLLAAYCSDCHKWVEEQKAEIKRVVDLCDPDNYPKMLGVVRYLFEFPPAWEVVDACGDLTDEAMERGSQELDRQPRVKRRERERRAALSLKDAI